MKKYKDISISAFTPPPNGYRTIDGVTEYMGQDFRTRERYLEYRNCGFDEIIFAGETKYCGENFETSDLKMMMDLSLESDLSAIVYDERIVSLTVQAKGSIVDELFNGDQDAFYKEIANYLSAYSKHPAFKGVAIIDEPPIGRKQVIKEISSAIHNACPDAFVHTCFLPCIQDLGLAPNAFGAGYATVWDAYSNYVEEMGVNSGIGYYGYDAYPFGFWEGKSCVCQKFIRNMQQAVLSAQKGNVPFHMTIQSFSSGANDELRHLKECDLNWQAYLSLGFGCEKIYYFTYWRFTTRTTSQMTSAIMDDDGTKVIYDEVQRNNALIRRLYAEICDYSYVASDLLRAENSCGSEDELICTDLGYIQEYKADAPVLVNKMSKEDGNVYMFLNLRDAYEQVINRVSLRLNKPQKEYEILVRGRRMKIYGDGNWLKLNLEPGEAIFVFEDKRNKSN